MFSEPYILIAIVALVIIIGLVFFFAKNKGGKKLTPLASLAFALVIAGIVFGDERLIGYSLMGVGVAFAVVDMFMQQKSKQ